MVSGTPATTFSGHLPRRRLEVGLGIETDTRRNVRDPAADVLLPDRNSQKSALHGLGHLHHPDVHGEVQQFIDTHGEGFTLKWLEQCRDGVCQ